MSSRNFILSSIGATLFLFHLAAVDESTVRPVFGKVPSWVRQEVVDTESRIDERAIQSGFYYTLYDYQENAETKEYYRHFAYRVENELGVQSNSELSFYHLPSFQKLSFLSLRVYRQGTWKSIEGQCRVEELREEQQSGLGIYDGQLTTVLILEDIRPGDLVSYEYMIRGANPIFEGKFSSSIGYYSNHPVQKFKYSVRALQTRPLSFQVRNADWQVKESLEGKFKVLSLEETGLPATETLENTPAWYYTNPYIEISEWQSWEEVALWGQSVFTTKESDRPQKQAWEDLLAISPSTADEGFRESLRFIQNRIRYLGLEIGVNSHKPRKPKEIISQLYGDCKDKSLLLCSVAQHYGYKAWPVFVNSSWGRTMDQNLPSPQVFDHVITLIEAPDGTQRYLDPTWSYQGGDMASVSAVDYDFALILRSGEQELVRMPQVEGGSSSVEEIFDAQDAKKTSLSIKNIFKGSNADRMRYNTVSSGLKSLEDSYLTYIKSKFPRVVLTKDLEYSDSETENRLHLVEYYDLEGLWDTYEQDGDDWSVGLDPFLVSDELDKYQYLVKNDKHPLALNHPNDLVHRTIVLLPWEHDAESAKHEVENAAFKFSSLSQYYPDMSKFRKSFPSVPGMVFEYRYKTKIDAVQPEDQETVLADIKTIRNDYLGYYFYKKTNTPAESGSFIEKLSQMVKDAPLQTKQNASDSGSRTLDVIDYVTLGLLVVIAVLLALNLLRKQK